MPTHLQLLILARIDAAHGGTMTTPEIGQALADAGHEVQQSSLSRILSRLAGSGWVKAIAGQHPAPKSYRLTADGRKKLAEVRRMVAR